MPNLTQVVLPGGHRLRRDANRLFAILKQAVDDATTSVQLKCPLKPSSASFQR